MRISIFCHSLESDWNHGNAHFLRGIVAELQALGQDVRVYEPEDGWSRSHLIAANGQQPIQEFRAAFPNLHSRMYSLERIDLDAELQDVDLVLVHEWNHPDLVRRIGEHRRRHRYVLLFHDTHHRSVTAPHEMRRFRLENYDGVLAFGESVAQEYERQGWHRRVWVWHEAADARVFRPLPGDLWGDLVWIGNWGDDERSAELREFLTGPVRDLYLKARVHGVRYPESALRELTGAGIEYRGWIPNYKAPELFGHYRFTIHVPRRPYAEALPGVPTIRVFEALACGIPLISAPWTDSEGLFTPASDFMVARTRDEMRDCMQTILAEPDAAIEMARRGRQTVLDRHTCAHRVQELMAICTGLGLQMEEIARA